MSQPIAIQAGYLVRYPIGGHILAHVMWMLGLQRLGYEPVFIEHYGWPNSCYDPSRNIMTDDPSAGLAVLEETFRRFGLGRWCYVDAAGRYHGMSRDEVKQACRQSELLLSIASTTWLDEFAECRTRLYLDGDPLFTQAQLADVSCAGYASPRDFQHHFSCAERIGRPDCPIPTRELLWRPTRIPVVLDVVKPRPAPASGQFRTIMSWTSGYKPIELAGETYGNKDVEFMKFLDLPQRVGKIFEIALAGRDAPTDRLRAAGWVVTDALAASQTVDAYLEFIAGSRGEFSVAKNAFVKSRSGVFLDRSVMFLASGKPVILQDTGFAEILPVGEGLFAFRSANDVLAAVEEINRDYERHCRAARRIAEEYFDAAKVVGAMLRAANLPCR